MATSTGAHFKKFCLMQSKIKSGAINEVGKSFFFSFFLSLIRARLVRCNDYYMGIGISITRKTLSWNVISITIY